MSLSREISLKEIEDAIAHTKSNTQAAEYLGVSKKTYKLYAIRYFDQETGMTLYEKHNNKYGLGVRRKKGRKEPEVLMDRIIRGEAMASTQKTIDLKNYIFKNGLLPQKCNRCGFNHNRIIDTKVPLIVLFKDKKNRNWNIDNIEFICYNCYYINIGDVFTNAQLQNIETGQNIDDPKIINKLQLDDIYISEVKDAMVNKNNSIDMSGDDLIIRSRR